MWRRHDVCSAYYNTPPRCLVPRTRRYGAGVAGIIGGMVGGMVGGRGVAVGGIGVGVEGTGVAVGGTAVGVGGTAVAVGVGMGVGVGTATTFTCTIAGLGSPTRNTLLSVGNSTTRSTGRGPPVGAANVERSARTVI